MDSNGKQYKGKFDRRQPDKIFIDIDLIQAYENQVNQNGETVQTAALRALITISVCLHELVHYSDFQSDGLIDGSVELGLLFEQKYAGGYFEFDENNNVVKLKFE